MNIAFLGTGILGFPMAVRLAEYGHQVTAFNRTLSKAAPLKDSGITIASSPAEAIQTAECIILVLTDRAAIDQILFGDENDLTDKTVIQMSTISPRDSVDLQKKVYHLGGEYFECPVLGSRNEAANGSLILLVGSTPEKFNIWSDFLTVFGPQPRHIGEVGKAAALKLSLNYIIAAHAVNFSTALGMIEKNDVDTEIFMDILRESSLYAPMVDKKLTNWLQRSYDQPNFPAKHLLKDIRLIAEELQKKGIKDNMIVQIEKLYASACDQGLGDKDYSVVYNIINNIKND